MGRFWWPCPKCGTGQTTREEEKAGELCAACKEGQRQEEEAEKRAERAPRAKAAG